MFEFMNVMNRSQMLPGKIDCFCKTKKGSGCIFKKGIEQLQRCLSAIWEKFSVGFSKFAELHPKQCV